MYRQGTKSIMNNFTYLRVLFAIISMLALVTSSVAQNQDDDIGGQLQSKYSLQVDTAPSNLRIYVAPKGRFAGPMEIINEKYYMGITPVTMSLDSGSYVMLVQTPLLADTLSNAAVVKNTLAKWEKEVSPLIPRNVVGVGECSKSPNLVTGDEIHCIMSFGNHGIKWVAKTYEIEVSGDSPKMLKIIF